LYGTLGLLFLWEELFRVGAAQSGRLLFLLLPLGLTVACIITVYFSLRNFLGNFLIFFIWLVALPVFFLTGLWHYYADTLNGNFRFLLLLPQLGGLHAWAMGMIHSSLERPQTSWALLNVVCWMLATLTLGSVVFMRKRL